MKFALVMTTIRTPQVLREYLALDGAADVSFHIVGDWKTPGTVPDWLLALPPGPSVAYYDPSWMQAHGYKDTLCKQENHDSLRVVGFAEALKLGADVVITVDDDNSPASNFFTQYKSIFEGGSQELITSDGWTNSLESADTKAMIFPRGFPYFRRRGELRITTKSMVTPVFHQGLTTGDPDIDALARFNVAPTVTKLNDTIRCAAGWTPVNTQNSALLAKYVPYWWAPKWCGRHWDIVAGLLVQALIKADGAKGATYGGPLTNSLRNDHDTLADARDEAVGAAVVEELAYAIEIRDLKGPPEQVYLQLAKSLQQTASRFMHHLGEGMVSWHGRADA